MNIPASVLKKMAVGAGALVVAGGAASIVTHYQRQDGFLRKAESQMAQHRAEDELAPGHDVLLELTATPPPTVPPPDTRCQMCGRG